MLSRKAFGRNYSSDEFNFNGGAALSFKKRFVFIPAGGVIVKFSRPWDSNLNRLLKK